MQHDQSGCSEDRFLPALQSTPLGDSGQRKVICDESLVKRSIQNISWPDCLHWFEPEYFGETFGNVQRTALVIKCFVERPHWQWQRFLKAKQPLISGQSNAHIKWASQGSCFFYLHLISTSSVFITHFELCIMAKKTLNYFKMPHFASHNICIQTSFTRYSPGIWMLKSGIIRPK